MKRITIDTIDNGYLVNYGGDKSRGYQDDQIALMFTQILAALELKEYKVVSAKAAAVMSVAQET